MSERTRADTNKSISLESRINLWFNLRILALFIGRSVYIIEASSRDLSETSSCNLPTYINTMLRFAFRSPYEHCIAPSRKGGGGGGGRGKAGIHAKKLNNATQFHYNAKRYGAVFYVCINVVVGQGWTILTALSRMDFFFETDREMKRKKWVKNKFLSCNFLDIIF